MFVKILCHYKLMQRLGYKLYNLSDLSQFIMRKLVPRHEESNYEYETEIWRNCETDCLLPVVPHKGGRGPR